MIIRKVYLLAGVIMAANMFVVNEMRAMNKDKKLHTNKDGTKPGIDTKKSTTENNTSLVFKIINGKENFIYNNNSSKEKKKNPKNVKKLINYNKNITDKEIKEKLLTKHKELQEDDEEEKRLKKEQEEAQRKKEEEDLQKGPTINNDKNHIDGNHCTLLKTLMWCGIFAKPLGSLGWSYANSIYHFENNTELDKVYFCKYILCVGYRWQPDFMKKRDSFFDININSISVMHSILCTIIKYKIDCHEYKVCTWKWVLVKSIFYTLPNSFNFNLNIKIKDSYFAINFSGIIAELLDVIFLPMVRTPKKQIENEEKLDNKI